MKRLGLLFAVVALLSFGLAVPVLAATPSNDTYPDRVVIGSIPFTTSLDTTGATTDALDIEANTDCGAPAVDASVWFEFTPLADGNLIFDVGASDYSAGLILLTGSPGSFSLQNCGPGLIGYPVNAGTTYTLVAFDDQGDTSGNGGNLVLTIAPAPPPPVLHLTVSSTGSFNAKSGSATIRGTITCTSPDEAGKTEILVQLSQTVGRSKFNGEGYTEFICDGASHPWAAVVVSSNGKFAGGKAMVSAYANACGSFACGFDGVENIPVTLRK